MEKQDRVREERAGGTRCCLLNPRDQYDIPYLFLPRNIANHSTRDTRICSYSRYHIEKRADAAPIDSEFFTKLVVNLFC